MKQAKRIYINSHPDQPEGADGLSAAFESRGSRPGSWPCVWFCFKSVCFLTVMIVYRILHGDG